jgi:hypothetical protein|tara:strand:- start:5623 stop:5889 length:267 start_codon:yes stop_codon:yes gene_type:complete
MMSANQLYKKSNSELPFKEWLKREQLKGALKESTKKEFLNAVGDDDEVTETEVNAVDVTAHDRAILIKGILIGAVLGYGIKYYMDKRK